ncbi:MAG: UDP-N-acetylmuramoylalanine--D-glutamate ligase [candidate division WS2 bacterium]|uniref:UDP-N-acetylmuramoylalanine--D-glutamate ligase n=1 Tax=Psychracetigena formicireducens TaxID=2986056 RepID=A0A9E2F0E2_PSYF1|nr:UDP-N-acetylmuramoylalanine--D-glutamate ligase [Candidatus Psychracetigena formicireducens]MBT9144239.1 UDP-N-acetylmuramoylalanine--D-glutamate ligase [Candidatus Psychracetigena formicireducens]
MDYEGKKCLIVGLADSGIGSAKLLLNKGALVTGTDLNFSVKERFKEPPLDQVQLVLGKHPSNLLEDTELIIISPGVSPGIPLVEEAKRKGIPVWGELELAYRNTKTPIIAISETHGKSTTTSLIYKILKDSGVPAGLGGNIRPALTEVVKKVSADGWLVVEASSFQLESIDTFCPRIALILNIFPDHLDRHSTLEEFESTISRLFKNMVPSDLLIGNLDDIRVQILMEKAPTRKAYFSLKEHKMEGAFLKNSHIYYRYENEEILVISTKDISLPGIHNLQNVLAAVSATSFVGVRPQQIAKSIKDFSGLPHRLQKVKEIRGVVYINDSKATTPQATITALKAVPGPKHLILGGSEKNMDFSDMGKEIYKNKVVLAYLIGSTKHKIAEALYLAGFNKFFILENLQEAVQLAYEKSINGDTVLLSPACASFDQFSNFEERGEIFQELVNKLT